MSQFKTIEFQTSDNIAVVTLNRPQALNAIDHELRNELPRALQLAGEDPSIRAVVLTGAGRAFSAGADLKDATQIVDMTQLLMDEYKPSFDEIRNMDKPVISAVVGSAAGIGLSLALVCDLTVMADDAFLLCPFILINLIPDGGGNYLLSRQLGYKRAYQMAVEAERMPAKQALECGLVNRLAPAAQVLNEATEWARHLATRAPLALAGTKRLMRFAMENSYDATFREEARLQKACFETEDCLEGRNAFIEKRAPAFKGK